jgi:conjugal transfer pilus assembly protein TrbC
LEEEELLRALILLLVVTSKGVMAEKDMVENHVIDIKNFEVSAEQQEMANKMVEEMKDFKVEPSKEMQELIDEAKKSMVYFSSSRKEATKKNSSVIGERNIETNQENSLLVFISHSMPRSLIRETLREAKKFKATVVLRGLKNDDFKEMLVFLKKIITEVNYGVNIDPESFKEYNVMQVPSFVLSDGQNFDKMSGNVSLHYFLEEVLSKGELKDLAKSWLTK